MAKAPNRTYDIADCNCSALRRAARQISIYYDRRLSPSGIRATQLAMLVLIDRLGQASVGDVGETLGLDRTTAGKNIRFLEREGLVKIASSTEDLRLRAITLTRSGRARLKAALPHWERAQYDFEQENGAGRANALRISLNGFKFAGN